MKKTISLNDLEERMSVIENVLGIQSNNWGLPQYSGTIHDIGCRITRLLEYLKVKEVPVSENITLVSTKKKIWIIG